MTGRTARGSAFTLVELLVALGLIALLLIVTVVTTTRSREQSNRVKCARQLRAIGQAILIYTNDNRGQYPRTTAGVVSVTTNSPRRDVRRANSRNHGRDGQNVLYGDGHVELQDNPMVGVKGDNIYARRAPPPNPVTASAAVVDSPYDQDDSVLLPHD